MLALLPILCYFTAASLVPKGTCLAACRVILAFGDVLDMMMNEQHVQPEALKFAVEQALDALAAAGWKTYLKNKFHWLLHFCDHLAKVGFLPKCWCPERKNKQMKHAAEFVTCLRSMQRSVLEQLLAEDFHSLKTPGIFAEDSCLINASPCPAKKLKILQDALGLPDLNRNDVQISSKAKLNSGATSCVGDVVMYSSNDASQAWQVGEIWMLAKLHGFNVALLSEWHVGLYEPEKSCATCKPVANPMFVALDDLMSSVTFTVRKSGDVLIFVPFAHRV